MPGQNETHPRLTPDQDRVQRGADPAQPLGKPSIVLPSVDPEADAQKLAEARRLVQKLIDARKPSARVPLAPKLLIRAAPGDHGLRTPNGPWPFWESPDIHVVPASADPNPPVYDPATNRYSGTSPTLSPQVSHPHWVFVHLWNLGPLPALNVTLSAWWANPQFAFDLDAPDPTQRPQVIGTKNHLMLPGNEGPDCHRRICVGQWTPTLTNGGHECLLARATCMADGGAGLDAYHNRHVGQRNLCVVPADHDTSDLMQRLGAALPVGADLELLHGLGDLKPLLLAHQPELAKVLGAPTQLNPAIAFPVNATTAHLGAVVAVAPGTHQLIPAAVAGPSFKPGGVSAALLDHPLVKPIAPVSTPAVQLLMHSLGVADLKASTLAARLTVGSPAGAAHVLRFQASKGGQTIGGYTLILQS